MDKLDPKTDGASPDIVSENLDAMRKLFPEVFTEDVVDFDALRETLGTYVDDHQERYAFGWNGKSMARRIAQTPSSGTLRPCADDSVDWDATQNLFLEGDNLEVLKLLQKSYYGRVGLIFIDPPYNTGNEFIYPDKYQDNLETYLRYTGQVDEEGFKLSANAEASGRYHTNWLNMMYPRLKVARNLLRDDGILLITIDDNESANLRKLCDEIFGEENFVACIAWKHTQQSKNDEPYFSRNYNSVLAYRKTQELPRLRFPRTDEDNTNYSNPDHDPKGLWRSGDVRSPSPRPTLRYPLPTPSGRTIQPPENGWRWSETEMMSKIASGEVVFSADETRITRKIYLVNQEGRTPENVWAGDRYGTSRQANAELKELFDGLAVFDTPKPTALVRQMLQLLPDRDCLILDFFAGSCTTADAVMRQNVEDGGARSFVMVQLPEPCPGTSEAMKAGYETIADLGKERIRRAGSRIHRESPKAAADLGFRVFKLDSSSVCEWNPDMDDLEQTLLNSIDNLKKDRSEKDVLYELLLKLGLGLSGVVDVHGAGNHQLYVMGAGALVVCLEQNIPLTVVEELIRVKDSLAPEVMRVVFRDSSFSDDVAKTNAVEMLRMAGITDVNCI